MHTIHESYTVIKQPSDGNSKAKKVTNKQFPLKKLASTTNRMDALDFYADHAFVDWCN